MKFNSKLVDVNYSYKHKNKFVSKHSVKDILNKNKNKKTNTSGNDDDSNSSSNEDNINNALDIMPTLKNLMSNKKKETDDVRIERDNNHIYYYTEVNRDSVYDLCTLIKEAEEESILLSYKLNIDEIPIYIHISSYGGSVYAALNAIDIIKSCKVPVYTIIEGATASAGTLISIVANKRFIRPNAHMLIHQLSSQCWGKMSEIEDEYNNLVQLMEELKNIYIEHTKIPKKELNNLLKHDLWLTSSKCISYGLTDELWNK